MSYSTFSPAVSEALGYYVYTLADPRTDEIFYVGKGTGDRLFYHLNEALSATEQETAKLDQIRSIHASGQDVAYTIHRHGLTEKEAFEVEAALIDFIGFADLTNAVMGHHSRYRGPMTVKEAYIAYDAPAIVIEEPAVVLNIHQLFHPQMSAADIYEATRGNWVMGEARRSQVEVAFAVFNGIVREIYQIQAWEPVSYDRQGAPYKQTRWRFMGTVAADLHERYLHGDARAYVGQNPVRYVNVD